jgi:ubiquinol-cytochrome c reductase cytochrome b subunit
VLVNQIVTGIFLTMNYKPDATLAFASVEYIMREVPWGWLIRYMHSTGASMFFVVVYLHMFRGLMYGSYRKPRELVWIFGCADLPVPDGRGVLRLPAAVGPDVVLGRAGDREPVLSDSVHRAGPVAVDSRRLRRLGRHAEPLLRVSRDRDSAGAVGLVVAHLVALHEVGSNNPDGIEIKAKKDADGIPLDGIPFHPYYSVHDFMGVTVFLLIFAAIIFFAPEMGGYFLESNNFIPANPLQTPPEIAPVWYFTAFYAMLRATTDPFKIVLMIVIALLGLLALVRARGKWKLGLPVLAVLVILAMCFTQSKFWGVVVMGSAVISLFFLPWLDRSPVKSIRYRPFFHKVFYGIFVLDFPDAGASSGRGRCRRPRR